MFSDRSWVVKAAVSAPPGRVFKQIAAIRRTEVTALGSDYSNALRLDEAQHTITLTGHWRYQGIYTVNAHPEGSEVTYRVSNVAGRTRTLAFLHKPLYSRRLRQDFEQMLRQVCGELDCRFTVEPDLWLARAYGAMRTTSASRPGANGPARRLGAAAPGG